MGKKSTLALIALLSLALSACSTPTTAPAPAPAETAAEEVATVDLTGEWEQQNNTTNDSVHVATIVNDTLTIYWVGDDDMKALYWVGTIDIPDEPGTEFSWESVNDKSKTGAALLGSQDDSKVFAYDNGVIRYETGALGVTWSVELHQTSTTPAAAPSSSAPAASDVAVEITGASFGVDYDDKPVIIVDFAFTNNSDEATSFMFSTNAQAFQGGIELESMAFGVEGVDESLTSADIKPGVTLALQETFILRDDSPVTVEVRELFSFDNALLAEQEFSVAG